MSAYSYRLPRKYRYRGRRRGEVPKPVLVIGAVVVAAGAAGAHQSGHAGHGGITEAAGIPRLVTGGGSLTTPYGWDHALLAALGDPQTSCNVNAVREWERREGGGFGNQAAYNPLNVNPGPGAGWPGYSAIGAWAFPDAQTGLRYTVSTIRNGYYGGILSALRAGNSAQGVCDAIMASPWAASRYGGTMTATC